MSDKNRAYIIWAIICQPHDSKASGSDLKGGGCRKEKSWKVKVVERSIHCDLFVLKTGVFCSLIAFDGHNICQSNIIIFKTICIGVVFSNDFTRIHKILFSFGLLVYSFQRYMYFF